MENYLLWVEPISRLISHFFSFQEKEKLESKNSTSENDYATLEQRLQDHENKYKELRDISEDQMTELEKRETDIINLKSEVQELEMKNSSLEGTLSSAQSESANLSVENTSLQKAFESMEKNLCSYIHENKNLAEKIHELEMYRDDLNDTCIILEQRLAHAEEMVECQKHDLGMNTSCFILFFSNFTHEFLHTSKINNFHSSSNSLLFFQKI